jgi:hypothetical protein
MQESMVSIDTYSLRPPTRSLSVEALPIDRPKTALYIWLPLRRILRPN